jgi:hypothetical protein
MADSGIMGGDVKAWVAAANMGLGHKRAIRPLWDIAEGGLIVVNDAAVAAPDELKVWEQLLNVYERLSRAKRIPLIGNTLFGIMDYFQQIQPAYPRVDLSKPSIQTKWTEGMVKKGLCAGMIKRINTKPLPLITSYYAAAVAADMAGYGRIYCIICDADINRVWVATDPRKSRIEYLVPCGSVLRRLKQYGVPDERLFMTGFPLPKELLGGPDLALLKSDLGQRLRYLDPQNRFWPLHEASVAHFLGEENCRPRKARKFTLSFAVGGAGAQKEIGAQALASLKPKILSGELAMNLVCGVRAEVRAYFEEAVKALGMEGCPDLKIIGGQGDEEYFDSFNDSLREPSLLQELEYPLVRVARIVLGYPGLDLVQPIAVEGLLGADGGRHDEGKPEADVEGHLRGLGPDDVGVPQARVEGGEIVVVAPASDDPHVRAGFEALGLHHRLVVVADLRPDAADEVHRELAREDLALEAAEGLGAYLLLRPRPAHGEGQGELSPLRGAAVLLPEEMHDARLVERPEAILGIQVAQALAQVHLEPAEVGAAQELLGQGEAGHEDALVGHSVLLEAPKHRAAGHEVLYPGLAGVGRHPDAVDVGVADDAIDAAVAGHVGGDGGGVV